MDARSVVRLGNALLGVGVLLLVACGGGAEAVPSFATAEAPRAGSAVTSAVDVEATVREVALAVDTARGLRDALRLAKSEPNWDRVTRACSDYPLGPVDPAFGVRLTQGLQARAVHAAWWPESVLALDSAAATVCFVTGSASAIPPGARVDPNGPTTSEIAAQPLQAALDDLHDASPQALRALVEHRAREGSRG